MRRRIYGAHDLDIILRRLLPYPEKVLILDAALLAGYIFSEGGCFFTAKQKAAF